MSMKYRLPEFSIQPCLRTPTMFLCPPFALKEDMIRASFSISACVIAPKRRIIFLANFLNNVSRSTFHGTLACSRSVSAFEHIYKAMSAVGGIMECSRGGWTSWTSPNAPMPSSLRCETSRFPPHVQTFRSLLILSLLIIGSGLL
jgi:hypothetical protein